MYQVQIFYKSFHKILQYPVASNEWQFSIFSEWLFLFYLDNDNLFMYLVDSLYDCLKRIFVREICGWFLENFIIKSY